jgi:hypothetical protein
LTCTDYSNASCLVGSTLAANSRGIKRFLTPTKKTRLAAWCERRVFCRVLPQAYQTGLVPQGVAHQPRVQHAARLGVKNRLMLRELAVCCLHTHFSQAKVQYF